MTVPKNLPNNLSIIRILLVPLLVVVLLTKFEGKEFVGLGVFLLAAFTDLLDGYVARRFNLETRLGKLLDPAADKILTGAAFISLVELGVAPAWMVVVIVSRELAVSTLRSFAAAENMVIGASWSGKVKTVVQVITIALLIVYERLGEFDQIAVVALWASVVVTLYSGIEYYAKYGRIILGLPMTSEQSPTAPTQTNTTESLPLTTRD